jgi:hypothetical protein
MVSKTINPAALRSAAVHRAFLAGILAASLSPISFGQPSSNQTNAAQTNAVQTSPSPNKPAVSLSAAAMEFPVILQQKVVAGKTPVGTKVQAKLTLATLLAGVVIPQDTIISGEVIESAAKSSAAPSRLAVRMDSAQFKNGVTPTVIPLDPKLYLTAWYYPVAINQNPSDGIPDAAHNPKPWAGGIYPGRNPNSPPLSGPDAAPDTFPAPASGAANRRVPMKNIDSSSASDGVVTLTSTHSNIKLDKSTTYVLAPTDLRPVK